MPVGVQWGNDPELTQAAYKAGDRPKESWVNPEANKLLRDIGWETPILGVERAHERVSDIPLVVRHFSSGLALKYTSHGIYRPADNFVSACLSCHSVGQVNVPTSPRTPNCSSEALGTFPRSLETRK